MHSGSHFNTVYLFARVLLSSFLLLAFLLCTSFWSVLNDMFKSNVILLLTIQRNFHLIERKQNKSRNISQHFYFCKSYDFALQMLFISKFGVKFLPKPHIWVKLGLIEFISIKRDSNRVRAVSVWKQNLI